MNIKRQIEAALQRGKSGPRSDYAIVAVGPRKATVHDISTGVGRWDGQSDAPSRQHERLEACATLLVAARFTVDRVDDVHGRHLVVEAAPRRGRAV